MSEFRGGPLVAAPFFVVSERSAGFFHKSALAWAYVANLSTPATRPRRVAANIAKLPEAGAVEGNR